ncbi:YicC family protein [Porphyromonadaceae bacterium OttesenSCG-928-L07]|nr:YicC family protein [Porphyromonadaceae bacterium OttesenSCG-928-L07]
MVKSMTGFGKAIVETGKKKIVIEIKSLNSKQLDINTRIPNLYKSKDIEVRNMLKDSLERGKVDLLIYYDNSEAEKEVAVNQSVVEQYYNQLINIADQLGVEPDKNAIFQSVMRFPDTLNYRSEELDENEWELLKRGIESALVEINSFRIQEGEILIKDILYRVALIGELAGMVTEHEGERIITVRRRLEDKLKEWTDALKIDKNRMEQEIIYYLEKLDITEEKVRLDNHCKYFVETVEKEQAPGRKLGFIAQEIGREINTMGSKANEHNIQKLVVQMKDELEKIKEQSLNLL